MTTKSKSMKLEDNAILSFEYEPGFTHNGLVFLKYQDEAPRAYKLVRA